MKITSIEYRNRIHPVCSGNTRALEHGLSNHSGMGPHG